MSQRPLVEPQNHAVSPEEPGRSAFEPRSFQTGAVLLLAAAHFIHDVFTSLIAPLLPLLIEKLGLSLVRAGSLTVFTQLPSIFNPLLGWLTDRIASRKWLVAVGPGVSGSLICLMGWAPSYGVLTILLLTSGLSVASLHVAAPVLIGQLAGNRIGRGMSFFMVAGELARTLGPLIAVQLVAWTELEGIWRVIPLALASSLLLGWRLRHVPEPRPRGRPSHLFSVWKQMRFVLGAVLGIQMARAFLAAALTTFLPTFVYGEGESLWTANVFLSVLELAGAAGALTSGMLSDRIGRRWVLAAAIFLSPPLMLLFLHLDGSWRLLALAGLGFSTLSTSPVLMAVVIENAGANPAAANGTYFMISFAARSIIVLVVGAMGDAFGLRTTYYWCAAIACLGLPFVLLLPRNPPAAGATPRGPSE